MRLAPLVLGSLLTALEFATAFSSVPSLVPSRLVLSKASIISGGARIPSHSVERRHASFAQRRALGLSMESEHHSTDEGHEQMMQRVLGMVRAFNFGDKTPTKEPPSSTVVISPQESKAITMRSQVWGIILAQISVFLAKTKSFFASAKARIKGTARSAKSSLSRSASSVAGSTDDFVSQLSTARSAVAGTAKSAVVVASTNAQSAVVSTSKQITSAFAAAKKKFTTRKLSVVDTPEAIDAALAKPSDKPDAKGSSWPSMSSIEIPPEVQDGAKKAAGFAVPFLALGAAVISVDLMDLAMAGVAGMAITSAVTDLAIEEKKREKAQRDAAKLGEDAPEGLLEP